MTVIPIQLGGFLAGSGTCGAFGLGPIRRSKSKSASAQRRIIPRPEKTAQDRPVETHLEEKSDEFLLDAYLRGDRAAFTALMTRYSNELLHFLTRFLGSRAAADDVFQDTFLQIHLSAETFDSERRFKPWLFTIAANKARDYHRKHSRGSMMSLSASISGEDDGECFVDLLQAEVPNPDSPLLDAERSRLVKKAVDSLPPHLREILLLSYFQGFSYNQIAESLEIPLGTVKSRLHTAVASFARAWKIARSREAGDESREQNNFSDRMRE